MKIHYLKIEEKDAKEHLKNLMPWTIRKDNFYDVGDSLVFIIINEKGENIGRYTRKIINVNRNKIFGLNSDYCVLTIR